MNSIFQLGFTKFGCKRLEGNDPSDDPALPCHTGLIGLNDRAERFLDKLKRNPQRLWQIKEHRGAIDVVVDVFGIATGMGFSVVKTRPVIIF